MTLIFCCCLTLLYLSQEQTGLGRTKRLASQHRQLPPKQGHNQRRRITTPRNLPAGVHQIVPPGPMYQVPPRHIAVFTSTSGTQPAPSAVPAERAWEALAAATWRFFGRSSSRLSQALRLLMAPNGIRLILPSDPCSRFPGQQTQGHTLGSQGA